MPRYIDADKLKTRLLDAKRLFCKNQIEFHALPPNDKARVDEIDNCIAMVINSSTADVVEIVRCKDCKYGDLVSAVNGGMWCNRYMMFSMQESYCRDGERRKKMYECPIELVYHGKPQYKIDEEILQYIQEMGINVDKEELIKALAYDRGQYDKGYKDGKAARRKGHWISDEDGDITCSECGRLGVGDNYCEHCGADMRKETDDAEIH